MSNDGITLDRLFRPTKIVTVGDKKLVVRALSDPEQEERSLYATNQARLLEKQLKDTESDLYQLKFRLIEQMDDDSLRLLLRGIRSSDIRRDVERENRQPEYVPFPDDATEEERKTVISDREIAETKWKDKIDSEVTRLVDEYAQKSLDGKERDALLDLARQQIGSSAAAERANMAYAYYTLYQSVDDEGGSRYFKSVEDAASLNRDVVFFLFKECQEVGNISPLATNSNGL